MMEKFLALLERFVVAHELLAKNYGKAAVLDADLFAASARVEKVEEEAEDPAKPTRKPRTTKPKAAPAKEPESEEEEEGPRAKAKAKSKAPDLDTLRDEIKQMATHIAEGDSDDCDEEFERLLTVYRVRSVTKLRDEDVEDFHEDAKELVSKYYEIED